MKAGKRVEARESGARKIGEKESERERRESGARVCGKRMGQEGKREWGE